MSDTTTTGEFRFAPSQDEILSGILEKRRWHRRYWTAVATLLPGAGALGPLLFDLTHSRVMSAIAGDRLDRRHRVLAAPVEPAPLPALRRIVSHDRVSAPVEPALLELRSVAGSAAEVAAAVRNAGPLGRALRRGVRLRLLVRALHRRLRVEVRERLAPHGILSGESRDE